MCFNIGDILVRRSNPNSGDYKVIAVVPEANVRQRLVLLHPEGFVVTRCEDGKQFAHGSNDPSDLIKKKVKKSKTVYLNLYPNGRVRVHYTEDEAVEFGEPTAVKIAEPYTYEWEE